MKKFVLLFVLVIGMQQLNAQATLSISQINVTCNGSCNGSATVTIVSGTGPFTYAWAPGGGTAPVATGLCAGSYTCTVTDGVAATSTISATITQPLALGLTFSTTTISCNGGMGNITANIVGGTSPFAYHWMPGNYSSPTIVNVAPGSYTCTVTDANGCTITGTAVLTQPSPLSLSVLSYTNPSCNAACNGLISLSVNGGTAPYTYLWSPSLPAVPIQNAVCAGTYVCTVTDANGCTANTTVTLIAPSAITISMSSTYVTCGNNNGTATANPSGGIPPYTYAWAPSGQTLQTSTGLSSQTYTCTVTDANGCFNTATVNVANIAGPTISISSVGSTSCSSGCNGYANSSVTGGTMPYTFMWTPASQTTPNATNLCAGTYTVMVTDANGCYATTYATITQPSPISVAMTFNAATCGSANGDATATPSGGNSPYTYAWGANAGNQTTSTATGLLAGSYTVTVTDANGCTGTGTVTVTNVGGPAGTISAFNNVTCYAGSDGSATVNVTGGTTPYSYAWAPYGGSSATAINLDGFTGTYSVTVTDANGCFDITTVTITQPAAINATVISTTAASCNQSNGSLTVSVTGGVGAYTYNWSPTGPNSTTNTNMVPNTNYTINITDANGCTGMLGVMVGDSCSYVWPGDANEDGVADNNDILAIGIANGASGYLRINPSLTWIGQAPNTDWTQSFASGVNYKYADCDGNGTIANADTNAVVQNFGFTHIMRMGAAPVYDADLPDLTVTMTQPMVAAGSTGYLDISLGNSAVPASNVYGVAFTLNFDQAQILSNSFSMDNSNCWMGTVGNNLMGVVLKQPNTSSVEVAITKFDHSNANGFGSIANLGFTTSSLLDNTGTMQNVNFTLSNVTIISANETPQTVNLVNDSVIVADSSVMLGVTNTSEGYAFRTFPNPANQNVSIILPENSSSQNSEVILTDAAGRIILEKTFTERTLNLDLTSVESGIYFCSITADGKTIGVQKLIKE